MANIVIGTIRTNARTVVGTISPSSSRNSSRGSRASTPKSSNTKSVRIPGRHWFDS